VLPCVAVCCRVLPCVAVSCIVLYCVAVCMCTGVLFNVCLLQCVAVCCSVLLYKFRSLLLVSVHIVLVAAFKGGST